MRRWRLLGTLLGAAALLGLATACTPPDSEEQLDSLVHSESQPAQTDQPVDHILLITIDTLRADALGFAGNPRVQTPVMDRLAQQGASFANAHAHNVVTLPSHANILTGLYPYQHGVRDNSGFVLPAEIPTAATLLREAGFSTGAFVAAYPLDARYGLARGFDLYDDEYPRGSGPTDFSLPERSGREVVARARSWWLANQDRKRFLWVHLFEPHAPYEGAPAAAARHPDEPYLAEVETVDSLLAPLLGRFLDGGELPTLIVLTSDHGEALGEHGEATHGLFAYESTLRVPLVLWGPGRNWEPGTAAARHVDLLPTMLDAAGLEVPTGLSGRVLARNEVGEESPPTYFEALMGTLSHGWAPLRGILSGGTKFISLPVAELYDLKEDPGESENLFEQNRDQARRLARSLPNESVWPPVAGETSDEQAAALRSLGYLSGGTAPKSDYGVEDDPKNLIGLDADLQLAVELYQRRQYDRAEALSAQVIQKRPTMGSAYSILSQVQIEKGMIREAIETMERALALDVASDSVVRQLALSLSETGQYDRALRLLTSRRPTGNRDDLNALAVVYSESGNQDEARSILAEILSEDPEDPVAHENLALVSLRNGAWEDARDHARRALAGNSALALAWNYLGTALYNLGDRQGSLDALQQAVSYAPANFDALYNVAAVALELGDTETARTSLTRFIAEAPGGPYAEDIRQARSWLDRIETGGP